MTDIAPKHEIIAEIRAGRMVVLARDRIYADFIAWARPQPTTTVLDVGVSDVTTEGANVLERLYPHPAQITAAGLGTAKRPHPLQAAFADSGAIQCGYCTPGFVIAAKALLDANPHPTEAEIREAISGNLCRCTGYGQIVGAIQAAAEQMAADEGRRTDDG